MARIRAFEEAAEVASQGGVQAFGAASAGAAKVRGPLHLSTGQEAVAAGVCAHLRRDRPAHLARTAATATRWPRAPTSTRMMCELFGRASGYNGGKGGSMHIADFSVGMLGANGVVAAGLPIAVRRGAGAEDPEAADAIIACFFGDGAINRGPFLEALNWARVYELPVLFVCEDNRWTRHHRQRADDGRRRRRGACAARWTSPADAGRRQRRGRGGPRWRSDWSRGARAAAGRGCCTRSPSASKATCRSTGRPTATRPTRRRASPTIRSRARARPSDRARRRRRSAGRASMPTRAAEVAAALAASPRPRPGRMRRAAFTDVQTTGAGQWRLSAGACAS